MSLMQRQYFCSIDAWSDDSKDMQILHFEINCGNAFFHQQGEYKFPLTLLREVLVINFPGNEGELYLLLKLDLGMGKVPVVG